MSVNLESISEATSGAIGALVSTTILYPLDTCKAKYQAEVREKGHQRYRSFLFIIFILLCSFHFMCFCDLGSIYVSSLFNFDILMFILIRVCCFCFCCVIFILILENFSIN